MFDYIELPIPKLTGSEPRKIYIYLPDYYYEYEQLMFPVLYMFDGHNLFSDDIATYGRSWRLKKYMDETATPMIIVGIDCDHSPDHGRLKEYSPFSFDDPKIGPIKGKGKKMMKWLVHTLKPFIDHHFRTLPERKYTYIAGSSMGGLMSIYALVAYNKYFSRAAALSPSLWTNPPAMQHLIEKTKLRKNTALYMDYGEYELSNHDNMLEYYTDICAQLMKKQVLVTSRLIPKATHCEESWEKQIPFFMNSILYDIID